MSPASPRRWGLILVVAVVVAAGAVGAAVALADADQQQREEDERTGWVDRSDQIGSGATNARNESIQQVGQEIGQVPYGEVAAEMETVRAEFDL